MRKKSSRVRSSWEVDEEVAAMGGREEEVPARGEGTGELIWAACEEWPLMPCEMLECEEAEDGEARAPEVAPSSKLDSSAIVEFSKAGGPRKVICK